MDDESLTSPLERSADPYCRLGGVPMSVLFRSIRVPVALLCIVSAVLGIAFPFGRGAAAATPVLAEEPAPAMSDPTKIIRQHPNPPALLLHSKPGSAKTLYLDFDGEVVANTGWNQTFNQPTLTLAEFDRDGVPGLGEQDLDWIYSIWQGIAEDMSPFDVDVTTERPSQEALVRGSDIFSFGQIIIFTQTNLYSGTNTATAWSGSFGSFTSNPGFVFTSARPARPDYYTGLGAWAVGRSLGLPNRGDSSTAFYQGTSSWGPIMGAAWTNWNTQWSRGEYPGATNPGFDEIAQIRSILGSRTDDHPANTVERNHTVFQGVRVFPESFIEQEGDVDTFETYTDTGFLRIHLEMAWRPNLNGHVRLFGPDGLIAESPTDVWNTAIEQGGLAPGWYRIEVSGKGRAASGSDPGVSAYGSLGAYKVWANPNDLPIVSSVSFNAVEDQTMLATWSSATSRSAGQQFTYEVLICEPSCRTINVGSATSYRFVAQRRSGQVDLVVRAIDQYGNRYFFGTNASAQVLSRPDGPTLVRVIPTNEGRTLRIMWAGGEDFAPVLTTSLFVHLRGSDGSATTVTVRAGTPELIFDSAPLGAWVDVTLHSGTAFPAPWHTSRNVSTVRVPLQRIEVPQVPPTSSTPGTSIPARPTVPQTETPVSSAPRPSVPQA
jgi:hypothetical protein